MRKFDANSLDNVNFRELYNSFLLVENIDVKTKALIMHSDFKIRPDDNAMLIFGYVDHEAGLSFELMCAAYVFDDGKVVLEPGSNTTTLKFRYGSFTGKISPFSDKHSLEPFIDKAESIVANYKENDNVEIFRHMKMLDPLRAPGFPDDIVVIFFKKGIRSEGIWCRIEDIDQDNKVLKMKMLNEPNADFGKHIGNIVDVELTKLDNGECKAVVIF